MDPLEEKVIGIFSDISLEGRNSNILEDNIVHSMEIQGKVAFLSLVIPEELEAHRKTTEEAIKTGLSSLDEIDQVEISVFRTEQEIEAKQSCHDHSGSCGHGHHATPSSPERTSYLSNYDRIIAVASGKGGVGKSTVALNLALALRAIGKKVSLFDADIYGPSVPIMMGVRGQMPQVVGQNVMPLSQYGIEFLSIGSLVDEQESLIWRGPMVHQALEQLMGNTAWPGGDYMVIDLPPGTGDVLISLSQMLEIDGAVIVSTPQDVALLDVRKGVAMFNKVDIPILGMVENMSSFICPHCEKETAIFSQGGTEAESKTNEVPFIGKIPIEVAIREGGDNGKPVVAAAPDSPVSQRFIEMAKLVDKLIEEEE